MICIISCFKLFDILSCSFKNCLTTVYTYLSGCCVYSLLYFNFNKILELQKLYKYWIDFDPFLTVMYKKILSSLLKVGANSKLFPKIPLQSLKKIFFHLWNDHCGGETSKSWHFLSIKLINFLIVFSYIEVHGGIFFQN